MKILKILFILLVPALGIVSCDKSNMKPGCGTSHKQENSTKDESAPSDANARVVISLDGSVETTDVVGSGDDDRDGGDKKTKKIR